MTLDNLLSQNEASHHAHTGTRCECLQLGMPPPLLPPEQGAAKWHDHCSSGVHCRNNEVPLSAGCSAGAEVAGAARERLPLPPLGRRPQPPLPPAAPRLPLHLRLQPCLRNARLAPIGLKQLSAAGKPGHARAPPPSATSLHCCCSGVRSRGWPELLCRLSICHARTQQTSGFCQPGRHAAASAAAPMEDGHLPLITCHSEPLVHLHSSAWSAGSPRRCTCSTPPLRRLWPAPPGARLWFQR